MSWWLKWKKEIGKEKCICRYQCWAFLTLLYTQIELDAVFLNDTILIIFCFFIEKQLRFASQSLEYLGPTGMLDSTA